VNYYLHFLTKDADGKLHIPQTASPEYNFAKGPDTNYDLALLKWGLITLIQTANEQKIAEPRLAEYQSTLKNLTDYPKNENGMMIAAGVPFARGHRHFSHLLMFYPLYLLNRTDPSAQELADKSVKHWQSLGARKGYSLTGASLISSAFGEGENALFYLNGFKYFIQPNTLYKEAGPVIETPLSGAQALQNMVLQSWNRVIRVFPAMPKEWPDATFDRFRTEGAFLVSAVRKSGATQWIAITSLAGKSCRIQLDRPLQTWPENRLKAQENKIYSLSINKGETVFLSATSKSQPLVIQPIAGTLHKNSSFGLPKPKKK
jgi:hypothetical protein